MEKVFNSGVNPVHSGLYVVDRGEKLGTPYRWFDAESQEWSRCEYLMEDVMQAKGKTGALGFLPWRGPVKVLAKQPTTVELVANIETVEVAKPAKAPKTPKAVKVAKAPKVKTTKVAYADGTIFFREDRQKFMAVFGGAPCAARPTIEAAKSFLLKKGIAAENIVVIG